MIPEVGRRGLGSCGGEVAAEAVERSRVLYV